MLIKDDPHYSKFKFERQSNFKPQLVNTLGIFENAQVYQKVLAVLALVSSMYDGAKLRLDAEEEEKKEEESKEPVVSHLLSNVLFD